jgi:nitronate monooxygenase
MPSATPSRALQELTVAANFVEVWLAKEGHAGRVGINLLEKIQFATLASLYGAMLAGVDVVLMGAGIPRAIPGVLDRFATGGAAELTLDVTDAAPDAAIRLRLDPAELLAAPPATLHRPDFFAIVSSAALAATLARKADGRVDGFVIESPAAGGHNAPPRGARAPGPDGQPVYGPRDEPELEKFRALGRPFWLAGERASPARLADALALGAAGVQIGSAFAFCAESGLDPDLKARACALSAEGSVTVFTDPLASPTGMPFKVLRLPGTLSDRDALARRPRSCDLGYLRESFARDQAGPGYRCPAEHPDDFAAKGGSAETTGGRVCLCNGLLAAVGLGQQRTDLAHPGVTVAEPPIVTAGRETEAIARFLRPGATGYSAADVLDHVLAN